ncbi:hypothetical protein LOTGIDRAFT_161118 [Lottia gigantea]|uniref:Uncharacterized protein n=1 Tax=Lottia gigantea TaxID=225164 RepID=V3ZTU7_LOTGI|nr:hypothetical protein LOTGIDRAFT_161118 [Lottia gigantea]ESO94868.1 hypothetical protein LOTGIDRAFT_161118 [Lottia gigantea]
MSSASLDILSLTAVKDTSDDSSVSELSDILNFSNVSSSDLSPSVELRCKRYSPNPDSAEKKDLRGRRKTRMAPQPPGHGMRRSVTDSGLSRSRSFNSDKTRNQVIKQASTDSDSQVSQYLDLDNNNKNEKETPSSLRGVPRDKSRFKALKDALRSPRHIRKNSRQEKTLQNSPSPSLSKFRVKRTPVTIVSENLTFGILSDYVNNECEFEIFHA